MEGGAAAMLTSSGQAANFYAVFNICNAGDHFICSSTVYGGTSNLFVVTMKKMGIEVTLVDPERSGRGDREGIPPEYQVRVRRVACQSGHGCTGF